MADTKQFANTKYRDWVKAGLALKYLREGIIDFVDLNVNTQHIDMLTDIRRQYPSINTSGCDKCSLKTLLPVHSKDRQGHCPLGQKNCNCLNPKYKNLCPLMFCSAMYDKIIAQHRFSAPNWKNTNIRSWHDNHWEIAKCNISDGYSSKQSAQDTDCSGLLQVIINDQAFQTRLDCVIDPPEDVFSKTRKARDHIFHSSTLELDEKDVKEYIDHMITILDDKEYLQTSVFSQIAKDNLRHIRDSSFAISSKDETEIIKEAKRAIQEERQEAIEAIEQKQNEVIAAIEQSSKTDTATEKQAIEELKKESSELRNKIQQLTSALDNSDSKQQYLTAKQDLQKKLIEIYETYHTKLPVLPMIPEEKEDIGTIFVHPICCFEGDRRDEGICSYKDILFSRTKRNRKIYISGNAGVGKTTFCKMMIKMWCLAHSSGNHTPKEIDRINQEEMKKFDFLFYVSLKHAHEFSNIDEMIKNQLTFGEEEYVLKMLSDLLLSGESLIILDGLDEWSPPVGSSYPPFMNENIPFINPNAKSTVITTTRPWKMISTSITSSEIDVHVKMEHNYSSSCNIADKIVSYLNQKYNDHSKESNTFMTQALRKHKFLHMEKMPIMLTQLICLWHDGQSLGDSLCDVYCNMIALFVKKLAPTKAKADAKPLPDCLKTKCKDYQHLLYALARLAFSTLFPSNGQEIVVFDRTMTRQVDFDDEDINLCLTTGILTESKLTGKCSSSSSISFVHKSFQEFFAALHLYQYKENEMESNNQSSKSKTFKGNTNQHRIMSVCNSTDKILEMEKMFFFVSGMDPSIAVQLLNDLYVTSESIKEINEYRVSLEQNTCRNIEQIQKVVLLCIKEMTKVDNSSPAAEIKFADIIVNIDDKAEQKNLLNIETESIKSVYVKKSRSSDGTSVLDPELICKLKQCKSLQKIFLPTAIDQELLQSLLHNSKDTLASLTIDNKINSTQMFNILTELTMLQSLDLCDDSLKHENVIKLFSYLHDNSCLREISLSKLNCVEHKYSCSAKLEIRSSNLRRVSLTANRLITEYVEVQNLEYLMLDTRLSESLIQSLSKPGSALEQFLCSRISADDLCNLIPNYQNLKQLELSDILIGTKMPDLRSLRSLEILRLVSCKLSYQTILLIIERVKEMHHPVTLYFGKCPFVNPESLMRENLESTMQSRIRAVETDSREALRRLIRSWNSPDSNMIVHLQPIMDTYCFLALVQWNP